METFYSFFFNIYALIFHACIPVGGKLLASLKRKASLKLQKLKVDEAI